MHNRDRMTKKAAEELVEYFKELLPDKHIVMFTDNPERGYLIRTYYKHQSIFQKLGKIEIKDCIYMGTSYGSDTDRLKRAAEIFEALSFNDN